MNEEFAVEPTAFDNALQLKYLLEKFGFFHGRFIVCFPKKWLRQAYEHIQNFPDIEQARCRRLLEKYAKTSVVPSGGLTYEPTLPWINNVHRIQNEQHIFDGILARQSNPFGYTTVDELDADYLGTATDERIEGISENYSRLARRLLQMSHEVTLIDPYLRLERPACEKVVKEFFKLAWNGNCRRFICWTRHAIAGIKDYSSMLEQKYKPFLSENSEMIVNLVEDNHSSEKMHARLLISSLGGLRFDHGFEDFYDRRKVDVSVISQSAHDAHCLWYIDPSAENDFIVIEQHQIAKIG
jgi:hypothetical protein